MAKPVFGHLTVLRRGLNPSRLFLFPMSHGLNNTMLVDDLGWSFYGSQALSIALDDRSFIASDKSDTGLHLPHEDPSIVRTRFISGDDWATFSSVVRREPSDGLVTVCEGRSRISDVSHRSDPLHTYTLSEVDYAVVAPLHFRSMPPGRARSQSTAI